MPANFGQGSTSGDGGGGGALVVATRSDNSNPAIFADFAALEAYTATSEGTTDAASINVTVSTAARQVFAVGTLNSGNQVTAITAAYIRLNDVWVSVVTNLVGTPGQDGSGSISRAIETITTNTLLDNTHSTVLVDATSGDLTVDLPAASTCKRRVYCINKIDSTTNTVTIDGNATETISGDLVKQINIQYVSITIQSDGSNWYIVAG